MIAESTKSRRRSTNKSPAPEKEKLGVYVSSESMRRLGVTSVMEGRSQSEIIDELIGQHLRKYVVSTRSSRPDDLANVPEIVSAP